MPSGNTGASGGAALVHQLLQLPGQLLPHPKALLHLQLLHERVHVCRGFDLARFTCSPALADLKPLQELAAVRIGFAAALIRQLCRQGLLLASQLEAIVCASC